MFGTSFGHFPCRNDGANQTGSWRCLGANRDVLILVKLMQQVVRPLAGRIGAHMTRIAIYDTTLRDGSQGEGVNFSLQDKLLITARLDELGVDYIEGGYPLSNPKDAAFFREVRDLDLAHAKVTAFGMTRRRDIAPEDDTGMRALVAAGTAAITVVGKSWDFHAREVLGRLARGKPADDRRLRRLPRRARRLRGRLRRRALLRRLPAQPRLRPANPARRRRRRRPLARPLRHQRGRPARGGRRRRRGGPPGRSPPRSASTRTTTATWPSPTPWRRSGRGALQVQGTINGIGERCGNVDLCSVVANLALKHEDYEVLRPESLTRLAEVSRFVYETANMNFRPGQPFVGASAFAHKGGMHVHGVRKLASSYEHIDPALVGNERRILVSELSGKSNIAEKLAEYGLDDDPALMAKVLDRVQDLENEGYQFEAADASFLLLVEKLAGRYSPAFERLGYRVSVAGREGTEPVTEATVKLRIGEAIEHAVSEGDGPVNALDGALRKALEAHFPRLREMALVDYKVRVINARAGTAARVRVVIESKDAESVWGTVGVSENVIEASWLALIDAFEHKLSKGVRSAGR